MRAHLFSFLGLLVVTLALFYSVLFPLRPLVANDSPYNQIVRKAEIAKKPNGVKWSEDGYLGSGHIANFELYSPLRRLAPLEYYNTLLFPTCVFLAGLGLYAFLLTLGLSALPAFTGALALILSGHFITCVFSGHAGTFMMWAVFMWDLFAFSLALKKQSLLALMWAGALSALVLRYQFDIGFLVLLIPAAFFLIGIWRERKNIKWPRLALGLILSALIFVSFGSHAFFYVLGLSDDASKAAIKENKSATEKLEKWDWATQWSLPINETSSIFFPGLFGWGQQDQEAPYYGAIGRSLSWPNSGLENFSLNTQGEGAVILLLALLGIAFGLKDSARRPEIIFWLAIALLGLLLSYGRYCDLTPNSASGFGPYRIFYWLPKMSDMRNPIKFLYPVMLALSVLTAFGMAYLTVKEEKHA